MNFNNESDGNIRKYWESSGSNFAHLKNNWEIELGSKREKIFRDSFLDYVDFKNKTIIDYGCSAGWFGKYLFENHEIKKYIGIDTAHRSLVFFYRILEDYRDKIKLRLAPQDFSFFNADIFISLACIQHFPSVEYLDNFLKNINNSNIPVIILHIRYRKKTYYSNPYKDEVGNVVSPGGTNETYVSEKLLNYKNIKKVDLRNATYLIYERGHEL